MIFSEEDKKYMRRALQLAACGSGHVSPNPMVGAVIVGPDGRIIGEGWHRRYGGPHAEVNAVRSVAEADRCLFGASTIYVTLEPCSHYGKTPPCAKLLVECGFERVVVGAGDPNPRVAGRGIAMLLEAGIRVDEGLMAQESRALNAAFMTAQTLRRPFVTLKWAQSDDGFMDAERAPGEPAAKFSTPVSSQVVHWRRACHDAIAVGGRTAVMDNPMLDVRHIDGRSPRPVIFDRHGLADTSNCRLIADADTRGTIHITSGRPLAEELAHLFADHGITSLLVEGGALLLQEFIDAGLYDRVYVERSPISLGERGRTLAPVLKNR